MEEKFISLQTFMMQMQLDTAAWEAMRKKLVVRNYKKRELFVAEGKVSKEIAFIVQGSFRYFMTIDGMEVTTFFSFDNQWAGAYTSFISGKPSQVAIETMEDTEVLILHYNDLQYLYKHHPSAERFGRLMAEYLVGCLEERMYSLLLKTPEERYLKTLATNSLYFERVPQHYIASYLGVAPESLSRIRKRVMRRAVS